MNIIDIAISELREYENNPRINDRAVEKVAASIHDFGFKVPIVIDTENVIVCGHTRVKAAQMLGYDTVPCLIADDLTPAQIKAFRLADNKVAEFSDWDFSKLEAETREIEFDMTDYGFDEIKTEHADEAPDDFDEYGDDLETKHKCPKCGYEWG